MKQSMKVTRNRCKPEPKHAGGRPTKLTPALQAQICEYISREDLYAVDACALCGISYKTFDRWMERGNVAAKGDRQYEEFCLAIKEAEAKAKLRLLQDMKADKRYFAMYMTILERRFPAQYGRQDRTQHEHGGALKVNIEWSESNGSRDGAPA